MLRLKILRVGIKINSKICYFWLNIDSLLTLNVSHRHVKAWRSLENIPEEIEFPRCRQWWRHRQERKNNCSCVDICCWSVSGDIVQLSKCGWLDGKCSRITWWVRLIAETATCAQLLMYEIVTELFSHRIIECCEERRWLLSTSLPTKAIHICSKVSDMPYIIWSITVFCYAPERPTIAAWGRRR